MFAYFTGVGITVISRGIVHEYQPRWLIPEPHHRLLISQLRPLLYRSFTEFVRAARPRCVCFYRTYALGDILMLMPIARRLRLHLGIETPIRMVVQKRFLTQLGQLNGQQDDWRFIEDRGKIDYGADVHVDLNGALESDHRGGRASSMHRLELYGEALGIKVEAA